VSATSAIADDGAGAMSPLFMAAATLLERARNDDDHHGSKMRPYAEVQCAATNRLAVTVPLLEF
jgi:hypothetical protein